MPNPTTNQPSPMRRWRGSVQPAARIATGVINAVNASSVRSGLMLNGIQPATPVNSSERVTRLRPGISSHKLGGSGTIWISGKSSDADTRTRRRIGDCVQNCKNAARLGNSIANTANWTARLARPK